MTRTAVFVLLLTLLQVVPNYSQFLTRIVGGKEATAHAYPFQAALFITSSTNDVNFCGGTLLSTSSVLTAAHCIYNRASSVEVILGAHNVNEKESTQQRFVSTQFIVHKEYDTSYITNDIAVVKLPSKATLNDYVQLVALPSTANASNTYAGYLAMAVGWGYDSDSTSSISSVLKYVQLSIITNAVCSLTYPRNIQSSNICTAGTGGTGTCEGDSGGPIFVDKVQVGIVSFGSSKGCEKGDPSVYTRVTSYLDWIQAQA